MTVGGGRFGPLNVTLIAASAVALSGFALAQARTRSPLIRPAMLRSPRLRSGLATSTLVSTVLMTTLVVGPFYLTGALDLDAASVGLVMSIGPVVAALTGVPAGRIADRFGARRTTVVGLIGVATGSFGFAAIPTTLGIAGYLAPIMVITASYALFQTANNTNVMTDVSSDERGVTSGMLNLSRNLGLITGASVMGAVFSLAAGTSDITSAASDSVATATRITFLVAAVLILVALTIASGTLRARRSDDRQGHRAEQCEPGEEPASLARAQVGLTTVPCVPTDHRQRAGAPAGCRASRRDSADRPGQISGLIASVDLDGSRKGRIPRCAFDDGRSRPLHPAPRDLSPMSRRPRAAP